MGWHRELPLGSGLGSGFLRDGEGSILGKSGASPPGRAVTHELRAAGAGAHSSRWDGGIFPGEQPGSCRSAGIIPGLSAGSSAPVPSHRGLHASRAPMAAVPSAGIKRKPEDAGSGSGSAASSGATSDDEIATSDSGDSCDSGGSSGSAGREPGPGRGRHWGGLALLSGNSSGFCSGFQEFGSWWGALGNVGGMLWNVLELV